MSGAKHTPGPWQWVEGRLQPVIDSNSIHTILDDSGTMVYRQHSKHSDDECLANRQLIASAPDLLKALECLLRDVKTVDAVGDYGLELQGGMYQAHKAIAKATGVQP